MLGLGISLARGAFASIVTYVRDNLKLFFNFKIHQDNPISHASAGSTSFDGTDDYVEVSDDADFDFSSEITLSAWVNFTASTGNKHIFRKEDGNNRILWSLQVNDTVLALGTNNGSSYSELDTTLPTISGWTHVASTHDSSGNRKTYVDGVLINSDNVTNGISASGVANPFIGSSGGTTEYFDGSIANVGIWSRALSASEVQGVMYKKYADLSSADQVSLVSWYGLDADYNDAHGSNNGTNSGSTLTASVYGGNAPSKPRILDSAPDVVDNYGTLHSGTALSFDGTNDYVDTGMTSIPEDGTISVWIKTDSQAREMIIGSVGTYTYKFGINYKAGTGGAQIGYVSLMPDYGTLSAYVNIGANLYDGNWHYITGQWDGSASTIKIYFDGKEQTVAYTNQSVWSSQTNTYSLAIGAYNASTKGAYFTGLISSSKLFDVALTLAQIQEMYLNPEQILPTGVSSSNLKLWLPLQEGSGTTNYDGSGNNNDGTISGATWVKAETDIAQVGLVRQNKPMVFDGSDDSVNLDGFTLSGNQATFSFWVKLDTISDLEYLLDITGQRTIIGFRDDSGVKLSIYRAEVTGWVTFGTVSTGQWHHIVVVCNDTTATAYLNSSQLGSDQTITALSLGSASACIIGGNKTQTGNYLDGIIQEVAIWDEVLTATEITALYNSGTPLDASADSGNYASSDGLVGYWRNDGDTTWTDRSTNSNHGTVSGSPTSIVLTEGITSGRDSQGFYLKDTDENVLTLNGAEYVEVPDSDTLDFGTGDFSVECWVKTATTFSTSSDNQLIIGKKGATNETAGYYMALRGGAYNGFRLQIADGTNYISSNLSSDNPTLTTDTWVHIATAFNKSTNSLTVFFDGVSQTMTVTDISTINSVSSSTNMVVGATFNFAVPLQGSIDEPRFYSKALSATEVLKNYNSGKSSHSN